jgi:hypothetical protein
VSRGTECILTQGLVGGQDTSRMLKQSASVVLASFRGTTPSRTFLISEVLEGLFHSPRLILRANGPHEVWYVPPRLFARCGLALGKRLFWQTQGGSGEKSELFEHPARAYSVLCSSSFSEACKGDSSGMEGSRMSFRSPVAYVEAGAKPVPKRKLP